MERGCCLYLVGEPACTVCMHHFHVLRGGSHKTRLRKKKEKKMPGSGPAELEQPGGHI